MIQLTGTTAQYTGRTVDLLLFDGATATREAELTPALVQPGQSGALIAGVEKLVQRFLLELLTEIGSLHYDPTRGTTFISQIRAGTVQTSQDLFMAFSSSELILRNSLRLEEDSETDPADERYQSSELLSATLSGDRAQLSFRLISLAGTARTVLYPLRTSITQG